MIKTRETSVGKILVTLGLLNEGILPDISTVHQVIYLTQKVFPFGFERFNWTKDGPYQREVRESYFELQSMLEKEGAIYELEPIESEELEKVRELITVDSNLESALTQSEWIRLLATYLFLHRSLDFDANEVEAYVRQDRPDLQKFVHSAEDALSRCMSNALH